LKMAVPDVVLYVFMKIYIDRYLHIHPQTDGLYPRLNTA
jgi:hypothetical protein